MIPIYSLPTIYRLMCIIDGMISSSAETCKWIFFKEKLKQTRERLAAEARQREQKRLAVQEEQEARNYQEYTAQLNEFSRSVGRMSAKLDTLKAQVHDGSLINKDLLFKTNGGSYSRTKKTRTFANHHMQKN